MLNQKNIERIPVDEVERIVQAIRRSIKEQRMMPLCNALRKLDYYKSGTSCSICVFYPEYVCGAERRNKKQREIIIQNAIRRLECII